MPRILDTLPLCLHCQDWQRTLLIYAFPFITLDTSPPSSTILSLRLTLALSPVSRWCRSAPSVRAACRMGSAAAAPPSATQRMIRAAASRTLFAGCAKSAKSGRPNLAASCSPRKQSHFRMCDAFSNRMFHNRCCFQRLFCGFWTLQSTFGNPDSHTIWQIYKEKPRRRTGSREPNIQILHQKGKDSRL